MRGKKYALLESLRQRSSPLSSGWKSEVQRRSGVRQKVVEKFVSRGEGAIEQESDSLPAWSGAARRLAVAMLTNGVWAQVEVGGEHLRLFSENNAQGIQVSVFNFKTKTWISPSEAVDDIEQGKDRAEALAREYLKRVAGVEMPPVQWKESRAR